MVRILADSSCDLSPEDCRAHDIQLVPLTITLEDGTAFADGTKDLDAFYAHLAACKKLPTTSQPSPGAFAQLYAQAKQAGDDVVVITMASTMSGTYQSACIAAEMAEYAPHVYPVDSQNISLAIGSLVLYAAQLRDAGAPASVIAARLNHAKQHLHLFAIVNDLNNLHKGGRLPAAVAFTGSLLGLKPLLSVKDGKPALIGKARGLPNAYAAICKHMEDFGGVSRTLGCYAAYTDTPAQLTPILEYYEQHQYPMQKTGRIGTVVGTHVGPGAVGLAYFDPEADRPA